MIICKTPYRISFFGGGTDYPQWYKNNKSIIISTTINHYSYITVKNLPKIFNYKYRIRYYYREEAKNLKSIKHPVIKTVLKYLKINTGLDIVHHGDLPARSGIGSSSSFTVGLLKVLYNYKNITLSKKELAKKSLFIEQKILRESVGSQDQVAVAYGGFNRIDFYKNKFVCKKLLISQGKKKTLEKYIQLFFINQRNSQNVEKNKIIKINDHKVYNKQITKLTFEAYNLLISRNKNFIKDFGELLNQQWELKKKLSKKISNKYINSLYNKAIKNGAIGGKILGAGGGGFLMMIVPPTKQKKVSKILKLPKVKVKFENLGSSIIYKNS
jgi:D-glycero-alpha-D-manno-heptose-7-phosphate kinase